MWVIVAIVFAILIGVVVLVNMDRIAVWQAPKKQAASQRSEAAKNADEVFCHQGEYEKIPETLETLKAVYLETQNDAVTAAHIAWLHNWRIAERARMTSVPATITDDTVIARRHFQEAVRLDPSDARTLGFLAGHTVNEGAIHKDEKLTREGYYMLLDAIKASLLDDFGFHL